LFNDCPAIIVLDDDFLKNFVFEQKEIDKKNRHITRNSSLGEFPYLDFSKHFQLLRRPAGGIFFRSHLPQSFLGSFVLSYQEEQTAKIRRGQRRK
jgi:hypothetical protein